jgi:cystathionine beta-lyase/cystathionine gamma-synthase
MVAETESLRQNDFGSTSSLGKPGTENPEVNGTQNDVGVSLVRISIGTERERSLVTSCRTAVLMDMTGEF